MRRIERLYGPQKARALLADRLRVVAGGGVHGQIGDDLQQVILQYVADGTGLLVELAAPGHAELLGHGDLDAGDVVAVPKRLQDRVGETGVVDVLHRLLAQEVVDPENGAVGEGGAQDAV